MVERRGAPEITDGARIGGDGGGEFLLGGPGEAVAAFRQTVGLEEAGHDAFAHLRAARQRVRTHGHVVAPEFGPVPDLAGIDAGDLQRAKAPDRIVRMDDQNGAVQRDDPFVLGVAQVRQAGRGDALGAFIGHPAVGQCDVGLLFGQCGKGSGAAGRAHVCLCANHALGVGQADDLCGRVAGFLNSVVRANAVGIAAQQDGD